MKSTKDDIPSSKDFSPAVLKEKGSTELSRKITFPLVNFAPFRVKYDKYVNKFENDEIIAHGKVMNILFGFPKGKDPPADNKKPGNYNAMVLDATKVHYRTIPEPKVMFVRKFPCKTEEDLGYKVTEEKNLVLFGWCLRLSILKKNCVKTFRKKQAEDDGNVAAHCYLLARLRQVDVQLVVAIGKEPEDCPLKLLPYKEPSKVNAPPVGVPVPEVVSPPVVIREIEGANNGDDGNDDPIAMESDADDVSEEVSVLSIFITF